MSGDIWTQLLCAVFTAGSIIGGVKVSIAQIKETQAAIIARLDRCEIGLRDIETCVKSLSK